VAGSPVFEWVASELEAATALTRVEARGTVRLALQEVALSVNGVARRPMLFVLERVLPNVLQSRGIVGWESVCTDLSRRLESADLPPMDPSPEDVFARLGGDPPSDPR
jgi:hypothetical protein